MSAKRWLRKRINRRLRRHGYVLQAIKPLQYEFEPCPSESFSFLPVRQPLLFECPVDRLRGLYWYPINSTEHPYYATLITKGADNAARDTELARFYQQCVPANAAEVLGISDNSHPLIATAPSAAVFPWFLDSPADREHHRNNVERHEARYHGAALDAGAGSKLFGPVADGKVALEISRLRQVHTAILAIGYRRRDSPDGDIGATLLDGGGDNWCLQIWQGHHRAVAAAAAGLSHVPVRIAETPVRRRDVAAWHHVRTGLFSVNEALEIFDRIVQGRPPPAMQWNAPSPALLSEQGRKGPR